MIHDSVLYVVLGLIVLSPLIGYMLGQYISRRYRVTIIIHDKKGEGDVHR